MGLRTQLTESDARKNTLLDEITMKAQRPFLLLIRVSAVICPTASSALAQNHCWDSVDNAGGFGSTTGTWGTNP